VTAAEQKEDTGCVSYQLSRRNGRDQMGGVGKQNRNDENLGR
jgi:hypothetical protein